MKTKQLVATLSLLFTLVSCSMGEDVMNDIDKEVAAESTKYASFSLNVGAVGMNATRSAAEADTVGATEAEKTIKDCSVIILEGDKVVYAKDLVTVNDNKIVDNTFVVKMADNMSVMIIANTIQFFSMCATRGEVEQIVLKAKDLSKLVKSGEANIKFGGYKGYAKMEEAASHPMKAIEVSLSQVAARIDLASFTYNVADGYKDVEVRLTNVELSNVNSNSYPFSEYDEVAMDFSSSDESESVDDASGILTAGTPLENIKTFYSFANTNENEPVTMTVTFTVDKKVYTRKFAINHDGTNNGYDHNLVKSSYLYRLNITITVATGVVDGKVTCSVNNWKSNKLNVDMDEQV